MSLALRHCRNKANSDDFELSSYDLHLESYILHQRFFIERFIIHRHPVLQSKHIQAIRVDRADGDI